MTLLHSRKLCIILLAAAGALNSACLSNQHDFGVGTSVGTTGVSLEGKYAATDMLTLRGNINILPVDVNESYDGVDYNVDVDMQTAGGFVDFHPFRNGFHLSGGAYGGDKTADLLGTPGPATTVEIGNTTYTGAQIGTLRGQVEYSDISPFVGVGFDGFIKSNSHWSLNARAGVMFVGSPDVSLSSEGGLASMFPSVRTELDREEQNLQDELDQYKYYPVVTVGITRRF